jgi:hypothetical protein
MEPRATGALHPTAAQMTLLELVSATSQDCEDDDQVVAIITRRLRRGEVELRGSFRGEPTENF